MLNLTGLQTDNAWGRALGNGATAATLYVIGGWGGVARASFASGSEPTAAGQHLAMLGCTTYLSRPLRW